MKRLTIIIITVLTTLSVSANRADSLFIVKALSEARQLPPSTNLPLHFARLFLGRPYVSHTLEVNDREQLVVNTRQLDCTTLVENVTALTLCARRHRYTFADFKQVLTQMRYRDGHLNGYASRLHYFSDWIIDNARCQIVDELQQPNPPFTAVQTISVNYMTTHSQSYKALKANPALVPLIKRQEQALNGRRFRYIPKAAINNSQLLRSAVSDGDIIAITSGKPGLDIAHLGFAVWRSDGLHLLNASQLHKKVVEEPMTFAQYLKQHPTHTGIRVIRIKN